MTRESRKPCTGSCSRRATRAKAGLGHVSQAAYETLHAQFPDTEWAAKTPYWYE